MMVMVVLLLLSSVKVSYNWKARALDMIVLQRENAKLLRECREMHADIETFFTRWT